MVFEWAVCWVEKRVDGRVVQWAVVRAVLMVEQ